MGTPAGPQWVVNASVAPSISQVIVCSTSRTRPSRKRPEASVPANDKPTMRLSVSGALLFSFHSVPPQTRITRLVTKMTYPYHPKSHPTVPQASARTHVVRGSASRRVTMDFKSNLYGARPGICPAGTQKRVHCAVADSAIQVNSRGLVVFVLLVASCLISCKDRERA